MFYINADPHGDYNKIDNFRFRMNLDKNDTMILLGDVAANYFGDERDKVRKEWLNNMGITVFCIQGNHEMRPHHLSQYKLVDFKGGKVWVDDKYPNVLFAKDGEIYDFDGNKCIVIGGAYSVDKPVRLLRGWKWFEDEQPSNEIKHFVEEQLGKNAWKIDYVFSHTCPINYEPVECFLPGLDQKSVDKSTEIWLGLIESKLDYKKWFIGHYHIDKNIDKMQFLFNSFESLPMKNIEHDFNTFLESGDEQR